jgi:uncharacterized protein (UPF0332 family)
MDESLSLDRRREVALYIDHAHQMLEVAEHNLDDGFYSSAVNRAYYAIFYAANALLATQGLARSKHSGVISAFREHFVKPGLIEPGYSRLYGRVMSDRQAGDYEIDKMLATDQARSDLDDARNFVTRMETYLRQERWL